MKKYFTYLLLILSAWACEDAEPLTAQDFINPDLEAIRNRPFYAEIDGVPFNTENTSGRSEGQLTATGRKESQEIFIVTTSLEVGVYFGNAQGSNRVVYRDGNDFYSSRRSSGENNAIITITEYDQQASTISGTFEASVYLPGSNKAIQIEDGVFNDLKVTIVATGKMRANLSNGDIFDATACQFFSTTAMGSTREVINASINNDTISINITINEPIAEKTYDISDPLVNFIYNANTFSTNAMQNSYFGQTGSITISRVNTQNRIVRGTFNVNTQNFNGQGLNFQNGTFEAIIQ
jgi:hypothetical protein